MAKKRYINTKFWSDAFVVDLEPLERYVFLYLLTNEHTNICGLYELPKSVIRRETDLSIERINDIFIKLSNRVIYVDDWILVKNFAKHQAMNESIIKGIERTLAEIPDEILDKLKSLGVEFNTLLQPVGGCDLLKPKLKPKLKEPQTTSDDHKSIIEILDIFKTINPTINYGHKTNRKAITDLIKQFTLEVVKKFATYAVQVQGQDYAPTITTPWQLKEKLAQLKIYADKSKKSKIQSL